jgi:GxxExxY protein
VLIAGELNRHTGPGLVESVYEQCLCHESRAADIPFERQVAIPIGEAFKVDIVVASEVILEIKPVAAILPVHEAQQHTYPRMSGIRIGLILNFNARRLTEGIRRYVL